MSSLTLNQIAERITAPLQDLLPIDDVTLQERLESRSTLAPFLDALAIEPSPLRRELEELITTFTQRQSVLVRSYLNSDIPLTAIAQTLIRLLAESGPNSNPTEIMDSLAPTDQQVDLAIKSHLPSQRERFALCGYGLGNGEYERDLSAWLVEKGTTVKLFGYDPSNACFDRETIQPCTLTTLQAKTRPLFDMVLTRWVLIM